MKGPLYISKRLYSFLHTDNIKWFLTLGKNLKFEESGDSMLLTTDNDVKDIPEFTISYLDSDNEFISYLEYRKLSFDSKFLKEPFVNNYRQKTSLGKILNKLASDVDKPMLAPHISGDWSAYYKSNILTDELEFKIIKGIDIKNYYHHKSYCKEGGEGSTLHNSCMQFESCQKYFDIYVENPEVCSLLVYLDKDNKCYGRAILWKLNKIKCSVLDKIDNPLNDENIFMDRIYYSKEYIKHMFIEYASKNNFYYKSNQNSQCYTPILGNGIKEPKSLELYVVLKKYEYKHYPYMDTLEYLDMDNNGTLSNSVPFKSNYYKRLKSIYGNS